VELLAVVVLVAAVVVGAAAQGSTGLGFTLVVAPVFAAVLDPGDAVSTVVRVALAVDLTLVVRHRAEIDLRHAVGYLWPAAGAVPLALLAITMLPGGALVVASALLALGGAAVVALAPAGAPSPAAGRPGRRAAAGFASGFFGVTTGMCGPPVALDTALRHLPPVTTRATLALFFLVVDGAAVALHPGHAELSVVGLLIAVAIAASMAASRLAHRVSPRRLQLGLVAIVAVSASTALVSTVVTF
jgi:uncharacterized protein